MVCADVKQNSGQGIFAHVVRIKISRYGADSVNKNLKA